ncbi:MAG: c-type cytochrome [Roseomonas sp.]|nr:c-type cytochrome [Roseomonas sp.]
MKLTCIAVVLATTSHAWAAPAGDASAGRELLKSQQCLTCHRAGGEGGSSAPNLSRLGGRGYTPARMAAQMWNHAPAMWTAMDAAKIDKPSITSEGAAHLFAYFYMARFFENRGDVSRGRRLFTEKGCAGCHAGTGEGAGPALSRWEGVGDPVELARQMWNHAGKMNAAITAKNSRTPRLSGAEMNDIAIYASGLASGPPAKITFHAASADAGPELLRTKGCAECHTGAKSLPGQGVFFTTADLAAAMWNHAGQLKQTAEINAADMRGIVSHLWSRQFEQEGGDASRGALVWSAKGCQSCHGQAPRTASGTANSYEMVAALWRHGPEMSKQMKAKNVAWPQFAGNEMADLTAYLKSSPR